MNTILSFSFFDILEYWDTITQYVNPLTIIIWAIAGGIAGFIIVLITQLILRKKILVRRRHWSLKILSYLYMVFFPLFAGYCFTQWFALHGCEKEIVKNIPTYLGDANSAFNLYIKAEVEKALGEKHLKLTGHEIIDKAASYTGQAASFLLSSMQSEDTTSIVSKGSSFLMEKMAENDFVKDQAVKYVEEALGEKLLQDKELTKDLLSVKIENILADGALNTIVEKKVKNIFGGLKLNAFLIFLIGIAIPAAEIVLAHYLERKRLKSLIPPEHSAISVASSDNTESDAENV